MGLPRPFPVFKKRDKKKEREGADSIMYVRKGLEKKKKPPIQKRWCETVKPLTTLLSPL